MSQAGKTSDRAYRLLKGAILAGELYGDQVEIARLSRAFGTSVTPVREAAMRLVGERLICIGEGGHLRPMRLGESQLRELYGLNLRLSLLSIAWGGREIESKPAAHVGPEADAEAAARDVFRQLAGWSGCEPYVAIVDQLSDQLAPARRVEPRVFADAADEARSLAGRTRAPAAPLASAMRRYHRRRIERVPSIIWELRRGDLD